MTSYSKGLPVNWNRGSKGGGGGKERVLLGKRVLLSIRVVFWGFRYKLKLPFKEYKLVLGFCS